MEVASLDEADENFGVGPGSINAIGEFESQRSADLRSNLQDYCHGIVRAISCLHKGAPES